MILETSLIVLFLMMVVVVILKDLLHAVIFMAGADALLALIFFLLGAPDIALTQIAVTAGLSTIIFIIAVSKTQRMEDPK